MLWGYDEVLHDPKGYKSIYLVTVAISWLHDGPQSTTAPSASIGTCGCRGGTLCHA